MRESKAAGGVVVGIEHKIVVVNQGGKSWSLPKGHIEPGETELDTAKREIFEESGLSHLNFIRPLGSYKRFKIGLDGKDDHSERKSITMFLFTTEQTELMSHDPHNPDARWVDIPTALQLLTHRNDKQFLESVADSIAELT